MWSSESLSQLPTRPTQTFQRHGELGQPLRHGLQRGSTEQTAQHPPEEWGIQRVTRQHPTQEQRHRASTPAAPSAPRAIRPLPPRTLVRRFIQRITPQPAVTIERARLATVRTTALLQVKAASHPAPAHRAQRYRAASDGKGKVGSASHLLGKSPRRCRGPMHGTLRRFYGVTHFHGSGACAHITAPTALPPTLRA